MLCCWTEMSFPVIHPSFATSLPSISRYSRQIATKLLVLAAPFAVLTAIPIATTKTGVLPWMESGSMISSELRSNLATRPYQPVPKRYTPMEVLGSRGRAALSYCIHIMHFSFTISQLHKQVRRFQEQRISYYTYFISTLRKGDKRVWLHSMQRTNYFYKSIWIVLSTITLHANF